MRKRDASPSPAFRRGFVPPTPLASGDWRLEPLHPDHTVVDHAAWSSCRERLNRELEWNGWPLANFSLEDNRQDLAEHYAEFERSEAYAYSVLSGDRCIGCIYVEPWTGGAQLAFWFVDGWLPRQGEVLRDVLDWLDEWLLEVIVPVRVRNPAQSVLRDLGLGVCRGPDGFVSFRR